MSKRAPKNLKLAMDDHITLIPKEELSHTQLKPNYKKDLHNILLLLFLYVLQGIPLGLAGSIPMILQQHNISYKDQATFSLAFWPFSIKILWAPIVDSCFLKSMGRRKSWLVPSQYLIGIFMLFLGQHVNSMLGENGATPCVTLLTGVFFALNFLAATQDIVVDGWGLTMLSKENVGWTSTCNSVGQTAGYFLGYVVFLALESKDFCVNYLGQSDSLVNLPGFLHFWGIIFIVTTTLVWILKTEDNQLDEYGGEELHLGFWDTYKVLWTLMKMAPIKKIIGILLTVKIGFACADALTVLKLTEASVPKDRLALLSIPLMPLQIFLPLYISKFTTGPRPMDTFLKAYLPRLSFGIIFAGLVIITPYFKQTDGHFPIYYYGLLVFVYLFHQITANCMFVSQMAFYARISDPKVGGTYMTLLNTFTNLGGNWPTWLALRMVSELTWKSCEGSASALMCGTEQQSEQCVAAGGHCVTQLDGYYIESVLFMAIGLIWYYFGANLFNKLQTLPLTAWKINLDKNQKSLR